MSGWMVSSWRSCARLPATGWLILGVSVLVALSSAFTVPVMSYFIVDGLQAPPYCISLFSISSALCGVWYSQWLGHKTDQGWPIKRALLLALAGMAGSTLLFALTDQLWVVMVAGVTLMALGHAAMPQTLALARRFADQQTMNSGQFNALVRANFSLAWIAGPPLAFMLVAQWGFSATFAAAAAVALLCCVLCGQGLPAVQRAAGVRTEEGSAPIPPQFWAYSAALFCSSVSNSLYVSSMPLYVLKELALPASTPGWAMAIAAGLEIPVMLVASRMAERWGVKRLLIVGTGAGILFYGGLFQARSVAEVLLLQLGNGLFFGLFAGLGISLIQDLLPGRIGFASAFYANTMRIGGMLGALLMGLIATWDSYRSVLLCAVAFLLVAGLALGAAALYEARNRGAAQGDGEQVGAD